MKVTQEIEQTVENALHSKTVVEAQRVVRGPLSIVTVSIISFVESALPIPLVTDPFMIAAILLRRSQALWIVLATIVSSVLGGVVAYLFVFFFLDVAVGLMTPAMQREFASLANMESGTLILTLLGAITPVPYTLTAFAVATIKGSLLVFIVGSLFGRGIRYAVVGYCAYRFGPLAVKYAKRYIGWTSLLLVVAIAFFLWWKL